MELSVNAKVHQGHMHFGSESSSSSSNKHKEKLVDTKPIRKTLFISQRTQRSSFDSDDEATPFIISIGYTLVVGKSKTRSITPGDDLELDMDLALEAGIDADVTINCKDGSFRANRFLLKTRSEVRLQKLDFVNKVLHTTHTIYYFIVQYFRMMFAGQNKESASGQVDFVQETVTTMKALVRFLYNGQVLDNDVTPDLLKTAHMLGLTKLRDECDGVLAVNAISEENVFDKFLFAHTYSAKALKRATGRFLLQYFGHEGLKDKAEWTSLKKSHPESVFDFFESTVPALRDGFGPSPKKARFTK